MKSIITPGLRVGDMEFIKRIGCGGEAEVWQVKNTSPLKKDEVAVKVVAIPFAQRADDEHADRIRNILENEFKNWGKFRTSPYVVQLFGAFEHLVTISDVQYILIGSKMPLADLGDIAKHLKSGELNLGGMRELRQFLLNIAKGVRAAHDVNVAHRDIKAANVLLFRDGADLVPRIMDFGLSVSDTINIHKGGTPEYMAPEQFTRGRSFSLDDAKKADLYSLGVLFYEIVCKALPYDTQWDTEPERWERYAALHSNESPDLARVKKESDEDMMLLIERLMSKDPKKRGSIFKTIIEINNHERASIIALSLSERDLPPIIRADAYRWNSNIHHILGNDLHYYFLKGIDPASDIDWLRNNLSSRGINGYSVYRVLGGYDYLVRVWLKAPYARLMEKIIEEFSRTKGGSRKCFKVRKAKMFRETRKWHKVDGMDARHTVLESISDCADLDNPENEFLNLKKGGFVTSLLNGSKVKRIRFFVTISGTNTVSDDYIDMLIPEFKTAFSSLGSQAKHVSIYSGSGDFNMIVKFTLSRFLSFESVSDLFIELLVKKRGDAELNTQTFVEMDPKGYIESDDGSIAREVTKYAARMEKN